MKWFKKLREDWKAHCKENGEMWDKIHARERDEFQRGLIAQREEQDWLLSLPPDERLRWKLKFEKAKNSSSDGGYESAYAGWGEP